MLEDYKNKKKPNFVYIVIDGARNSPSPWNDKELGGTAGRPEIFDDFIKESVWFNNAVCAAPSTIMSFSSTFTGFPSCFLARNFADFKLDNTKFDSLINILKSNGYHIYTITPYSYGRKYFKDMLFPIDSKYWPKGTPANKNWSTETTMAVFDNVVKEKDLVSPFSLLIHLCVRWDRLVSDKVRKVLDYLKSIGEYDNSIIVLCSDHGLPDPKREIPINLLRNRGHDLILTDDNILIPLCIKYPGSPVRKIESVVSSLDIMPTILDLLNLSYSNKIDIDLKGKSLLPLIENSTSTGNDSRIVLTECRFISQSDRTVSLRGDRYKYVFFYDEPEVSNEQFFDLLKDPLELENIFNENDSIVFKEIERFRKEFKRYEEELHQFQHKYLVSEFSARFDCLFQDGIDSIQNVLVFGSCDVQFTKALLYGLNEKISVSGSVDLISFGDFKRGEEASLIENELNLGKQDTLHKEQIKEWVKGCGNKRYDMVLVIMNDTGRYLFFRSLNNIARKLSKKVFFINLNMEISESFKKQKIPFGSNPDVPQFIRNVYKWIGSHYYRRYWYLDDIKLTLNRWIPFLHLKTFRKE